MPLRKSNKLPVGSFASMWSYTVSKRVDPSSDSRNWSSCA